MQKLSMDQLQRVDVESYKTIEKNPIVLVLDNVRSMHNVGSAFRSADAFAIEKIILCGITAQPPHREIEKTALGATESVDWEHILSTTEAITTLKNEGYQILAIEQTNNSIELQNYEFLKDKKYALVVGNEVHGVHEDVIKQCHAVLEIPQFGTKHSLNVSVTTGIILWEGISKLKLKNKS